jgi:F-type H+-transporting ATPase subunit c
MELSQAMAYLGAGIAMLGVFWAWLGIGLATKGLLEALSRNPEKEKSYMIYGILGMALAEATAIYALVVAIMLMNK